MPTSPTWGTLMSLILLTALLYGVWGKDMVFIPNSPSDSEKNMTLSPDCEPEKITLWEIKELKEEETAKEETSSEKTEEPSPVPVTENPNTKPVPPKESPEVTYPLAAENLISRDPSRNFYHVKIKETEENLISPDPLQNATKNQVQEPPSRSYRPMARRVNWDMVLTAEDRKEAGSLRGIYRDSYRSTPQNPTAQPPTQNKNIINYQDVLQVENSSEIFRFDRVANSPTGENFRTSAPQKIEIPSQKDHSPRTPNWEKLEYARMERERLSKKNESLLKPDYAGVPRR